jgi:serine protease Do
MNLDSYLTEAVGELVQRVIPSLVIVHGHRSGAGAGMIWREDGLILTNHHVIGRRPPKVVLQNDHVYEARLIARDSQVDLALLSIDAAHLTPLRPSTVSPRIGELVLAFGHPWGQRNTVTRGILSALVSVQIRGGTHLPVIRSDVPLAPGNSGGPLVNAHGDVIGINAMIVGGDQSLSIAVPAAVEFVRQALAGEKRYERSDHPVPEGLI